MGQTGILLSAGLPTAGTCEPGVCVVVVVGGLAGELSSVLGVLAGELTEGTVNIEASRFILSTYDYFAYMFVCTSESVGSPEMDGYVPPCECWGPKRRSSKRATRVLTVKPSLSIFF